MARGRAKRKQKTSQATNLAAAVVPCLCCVSLITVLKETYDAALVLGLQRGSKKVGAQPRHMRKCQHRRQESRRRGGKRRRMEFCSGELSSEGKKWREAEKGGNGASQLAAHGVLVACCPAERFFGVGAQLFKPKWIKGSRRRDIWKRAVDSHWWS